MPRIAPFLCAGALCAIGGCSSGPDHRSAPPPERTESATPAGPTAADLPEPERPFVGRWRIDNRSLASARSPEGKPSMDPMAFAAFSALIIDLEADHSAAAYWGLAGGTGTWTLAGDTVTLAGPAPNFKGTRLVRTGEKMTCSLGGVNPPFEMLRVEPGASIDPLSLDGQWRADMDASAAASEKAYRQKMDTVRAMYGDSIAPVPTVSPEMMRAQLSALFGGRRPAIAIAADPKSGGGVGEIRGMGSQPMPFTYTLTRDILFIKDASVAKGSPQVAAFRVADGHILWDFGTAVFVFNKQ